MIIGVVFVVVWLVAALIGGAIVGSQNRPTNIDPTGISGADCEAACRTLLARRIETCRMQQQASAFQNVVDMTGRDLAIAAAIHVGLVAAAVAAAFIPFVGAILAVGFGAAATVALGVVSMLAGRLAAQSRSLDEARAFEEQARQREADAKIEVVNSCPADKAKECLENPLPC